MIFSFRSDTDECIESKICSWPGSGTDSAVSLEIFSMKGINQTRVCKTNTLDYSFTNDWRTNGRVSYCGHKFLGECMGKDFGDRFRVVLFMSNPIIHFFKQRDELCLEEIWHIRNGSPDEKSISKGWSDDLAGPDTIATNFS